MSFIQLIYLYALTVPVFFAIDMVWLGFVANKFYQAKLEHLLGPVNWPAAVIFYLMYIVGILIFAVVPALNAQDFQKAILYGALFGFFCYATYDFTNLSTLRDWPLSIVIVDVIWGTILTGSVAACSYLIGKALFF